MNKTIRDGLCSLSLEICQCADRETGDAKEHALKSIDGDLTELALAKEHRSRAEAFMITVKRIDNFRMSVERGDFK